jgi:hypothetical protein
MTKGPVWEELEKLGLNEHRDDPIEETKRCLDKWAYSHSSGAEDADEREASVTYSFVIKTLPMVLPLAERGATVGKGASEGGGARSESFEKERKLWRDTAEIIKNERHHRSPSKSELSRLVADRLRPELSEKGRLKLADSRRKWLD